MKSLTDFGAFIGLDEGIDGLIHISDMSWTKHIKHPSELFKKGQKVEPSYSGSTRKKNGSRLATSSLAEILGTTRFLVATALEIRLPGKSLRWPISASSWNWKAG